MIETGTVLRADGKRYAAVRKMQDGKAVVRATRGFGSEEAYYGTNAKTAATFEPDRLHLSGSTESDD